MSETIFSYSVPQLVRGLNVALSLLAKARDYAAAKEIESSVLVNDRLYCNMFDFKRQIQIISDTAKNGVARLSEQQPPEMPDDETTIEDLETRLKQTLEYIEKFSVEDFSGAEERSVTMPLGPGAEGVFKSGTDYVQGFMLPNFYFHLTTAYNLLRKNGIDIGKQDYIGAIDLEIREVAAG